MVTDTILQRAGFLFRALTRRRLDILDLLESDHMKIDFLFLQWKFMRDAEGKEKIFSALKRELLSHIYFEETYFYPACEKIPALKTLMTESYEDHKHVKMLIKEISGLSIDSDRAGVKMKLLNEEIRSHFFVEENQVFVQVRSIMKRNQFDKLSRELRIAKQHKAPRAAA